MSVFIEFNVINANILVDNGMLFNGENQVFGWSSHIKQNHPLFASGKFNLYTEDYNIVCDNDVLDMTVYDPDFTIGTGIEAF